MKQALALLFLPAMLLPVPAPTVQAAEPVTAAEVLAPAEQRFRSLTDAGNRARRRLIWFSHGIALNSPPFGVHLSPVAPDYWRMSNGEGAADDPKGQEVVQL